MSFSKESNAAMPMKRLSESRYASRFAGPDATGRYIYPEVAAGNPKDTIATSGIMEKGSVDRRLGFDFDPLVSNEFVNNAAFLNDFYFPSVTGEKEPFLSEDVRFPF